ncbi:GNAT family N-acetyltransferase [Paucidesulfovibrio longus]|uniref:GNAT family N-acetyltransferase n=1 Tax=Paucidesulfovibrio longus TaxID=889 RepID=UPI0003B766F6|nr:GNAT family N-acetyltransferase [Paucidesulfovibrio longus]
MNAPLRIRQAQANDAEELLALQKAAFQSEAMLYGMDAVPAMLESLEQMRDAMRGHLFLKAMDEGRIAGSVRANLDGGTCRIGRLVVAPALQRRGIGSRLMDAIETRFPDAEHFEIFTGHKSEGNLRLYRRLGYEEYLTQQVRPGLTVVFMRKARRG